jgi:iron complex transport system ATP-binding protein
MTAHVLQAADVQFAYRPERPVLRGVSFTAQAGKLLCILGSNGSGKTTLLRCLLNRLRPTAGRILLDGRDVRKHSPRQLARLLAYVPQVPTSAFGFTVRELVLMGRFAHAGALGMTGEQDLAVAKLAMQMTNTEAFADRTLDELSGGEAQCAMIARALAQQPSVMLLDEPTSHLDIRNQLVIYRMMQRLAHDWQMAVVCVSHDVNVASRFADRLLLMRAGEVVADGPPTEVISPEIIAATYDVKVELVSVPDSPVPLVLAR